MGGGKGRESHCNAMSAPDACHHRISAVEIANPTTECFGQSFLLNVFWVGVYVELDGKIKFRISPLPRMFVSEFMIAVNMILFA